MGERVAKRVTTRKTGLEKWLEKSFTDLWKQLDLESDGEKREVLDVLTAVLSDKSPRCNEDPLFAVKQKRYAGVTSIYYDGLKSVCYENLLADDPMSAMASLIAGEKSHIYDSQCFAQFCQFKASCSDRYVRRLRRQIEGCDDFGIVVNLGNWHWVCIWYSDAECNVAYNTTIV